MQVQDFITKWSGSSGSERANKDPFLLDLCDTLGVEKPRPATGDPAKDVYVFERPAVLAKEKGASVGRIDLYKDGCFILEAKQGSNHDSKKLGHAKRGTPGWNIAMRDAYGQALGYAHTLDDPPPFILTTDIGYCFEFYSAFDGNGVYRSFPNAQKNRVYLKDLPQHVDTLRAVFTDPYSLDPAKKATKVTREVAAHLAELARSLEEAKHPPERVAKFLMRCIFTMFAEDVGMLPDNLFTTLLRNQWLLKAGSFPKGIQSLWKAMNDGSEYVVGKLLRFNGGLFKDSEALPLTAKQLLLLEEAAACDWSEVEPAIFGTLLERALNPRERHLLGAHFTPRAYVERLVGPTIEEPLRADWDLVRAEVRQLVDTGKEALATRTVHAFYDKLCHIKVLDPACGTGNFLYVTLDIFKRLEAEVVALLSELEETQTLTATSGYGVTPQQFLGIEVKPWAKEIAELVLWIGYLQWHFRTRGRVAPPEPVLQDYGNIECRDAILDWSSQEPVLDEKGDPATAWDRHTMKVSPLTGEGVPDETSRVPIMTYVNPRAAKWPNADFIVGNPPYIGARRIRFALPDSYVDALRASYPDVAETADLVMYWWRNAAQAVMDGKARAFGLITTNSITQGYSRPVLEKYIDGDKGIDLVFALPDHPWVDTDNAAFVRVAMTAGVGRGQTHGVAHLGQVVGTGDDLRISVEEVARINSSLTAGVNARSAEPLRANQGVCFQGVVPAGDGFKLTPEEASDLGYSENKLPSVLRPYIIGRDIVQRAQPKYIIDFFGLTAEDARGRWPALFQRVFLRVLPERKENARASYRDKWWIFAEPRPAMRRALAGLKRFIVTPYTAKFRPFTFVDGDTIADAMAYVVATEDAGCLGVLSSRPHRIFALAAGGRLGVGNDPRYNSKVTFFPFPFPELTPASADAIRDLGEKLDAHRKQQQEEHPDLTITGMYNVLEKLRSGEPLSVKDRVIHEKGLVTILGQLHDELDAAVFDAYKWPRDLTDEQVLERLLKLNAVRLDEERRGVVRWLRADFQNPSGATVSGEQVDFVMAAEGAAKASADSQPWPKKLRERVAAVRAVFARGESMTTSALAAHFKGAKPADVDAVLRSLAALGLAVSFEVEGVRRWRLAGRLAA